MPAQQSPKLTVSPPGQLAVARGATATAAVNITTLPGFHVNSDKPRDEFLIPLKLTWAPGVLQPQTVTYPHAEDIQVGNDTLSVFTGTFAIKTEFKAPADARSGPAEMIGKLHYQACNNRQCFRPGTVDVRLPVVVR